jgi:hypothetical protein
MKDQSYSKSNKEKTPREKKRSSRRPILHGIFASEMLLPWERKRDFLGLYEKFRYELRPEGASEEEVVLDYTWLHWLKRRAFRAVQFSSVIRLHSNLQIRGKKPRGVSRNI